MKLCVVGGGGIRAPLFVQSLLRRQEREGQIVTHLTLHDIQGPRLEVIEPMARHLIAEAGSPLVLETTTDLDAALDGADYVVTTIRAGFEQGRIHDERVPLSLGCLGQETVGPGGFAMALRSIPAILEIAERAAHRAPKAWIVNFTNPASIVTQGLHDAGFTNAVGICDSSDTMARDAAAYLGLVSRDIRLRVFGLNHCSFAGEIIAGGEDVLPKLLADDAFLDRFLGLYEKPLLRELGALPNEYLYYYFSCDKAVGALLAEKKTRGELVKEMHDEFFRGARENGSVRPVAALFELHESLLARRHKTYMDYAWKESKEGQRPKEKTETDPEGYAGVALDLIQGLSSASPRRVVLNYRNGGALDAFAHHDIAELSYDVSTDGIKPVAPPRVPERARELFARVKLFENLTSTAARTRSRRIALAALEASPHVPSRDTAERLLDGFAAAHGGIVAEIAKNN